MAFNLTHGFFLVLQYSVHPWTGTNTTSLDLPEFWQNFGFANMSQFLTLSPSPIHSTILYLALPLINTDEIFLLKIVT
jgi:hypothetical protein